MSKVVQRELSLKVTGVASLNPFVGNDSSPRLVMSTQHLGQNLQVEGCDIRRLQTGAERQFGKATFSKKFPVNANIIRVVPRYRTKSIGSAVIKENPQDIVIYDNCETVPHTVSILSLERFHCIHQHYGFKYQTTQAHERLYKGANFARGTIIADSPAVDTHGNYKYGVETNVIYMSIPGVIEDGVVISEAYAKRLTTKGFETVIESWGKNYYPVNLYGDPTDPLSYKPNPDIGDKIREDGLVFALRRYDDLLGPIEMTPEALREPDRFYDKCTYVTKPGARVVDVKVWRAGNDRYSPTPSGMTEQSDKYHQALLTYYRELLSIYGELKRNRGRDLRISKEFSNLLVEAIAYLPDSDLNRSGPTKVRKAHRRVPLDDIRVAVTYEYDEVPGIGFKLTNLHGGKGVVCAVWSTEDMPVDSEGNRAEIIMDGDSIIKRMNLGCLYEQYYNGASRDVSKHVRKLFGLDSFGANLPSNLSQLIQGPSANQAWDYLAGYYQLAVPPMLDLLKSPAYTPGPIGHVTEVVKDGVYLWMPPDNPTDPVGAIQAIQEHYPPHIGPVTYRGRSGRMVTTKASFLIASVYIILLEKTGGDFSGVSSAKLQHFGMPAKLTKFDARSAPVREQPVRVLGEAEVRAIENVCGSDVVASLLDQSNSPGNHKTIVANIFRAEKPSHIEEVIDGTLYPQGNGRNLVFIRHIMASAGAAFVYAPEQA